MYTLFSFLLSVSFVCMQNSEFSFEHVAFVIFMRQPNRDVERVGGHPITVWEAIWARGVEINRIQTNE